jgi:hypothetical protein
MCVAFVAEGRGEERNLGEQEMKCQNGTDKRNGRRCARCSAAAVTAKAHLQQCQDARSRVAELPKNNTTYFFTLLQFVLSALPSLLSVVLSFSLFGACLAPFAFHPSPFLSRVLLPPLHLYPPSLSVPPVASATQSTLPAVRVTCHC